MFKIYKEIKIKSKLKFKISNDKQYNTDNPQNRCPNLSKIKKINNWKIKIKTGEGIERTLKYYNILI